MSFIEPKNVFVVNPANPAMGQWRSTRDYDVWSQCLPEEQAPLTLWEALGNGVLKIPDSDSLMHIITAGTPHHVEHLFGYWRVCEADIIWFRARRHGMVYYTMVLGGCPPAYLADTILWICPKCATRLSPHSVAREAKKKGKFWAEEVEVVNRFNASTAQRICPSCHHEHPPAYSFQRTIQSDQSGYW
jgi:hypothetical protein